jgi:DNA replication protein DnaC
MARNRRSPAPDPVEELIQLAIDLDLIALAAGLCDILDRAERDGMSFMDFGLALLCIEVLARKNCSLDRSFRRSHFGIVEGFEGFKFVFRSQFEFCVVKELFNCCFVEDKRNVLCLGRSGLGKTRIAKVIAHAVCMAGYSTLCVVIADMLEDLHASQADAIFKRTMRRYVKLQVLVLDEFAYELFDSAVTVHLFRVVFARYGQGSIILIVNTGFSHWKNLFPSESQAIVIVDRLVDRATILRFTGKICRNPFEISGALLD